MNKIDFEQFKEYLKLGSDEKRAFDLDGVLNSLIWSDSVPYDRNMIYCQIRGY